MRLYESTGTTDPLRNQAKNETLLSSNQAGLWQLRLAVRVLVLNRTGSNRGVFLKPKTFLFLSFIRQ